MRIVITKCSHPGYWYYNNLNSIYEVEHHDPSRWVVIEGKSRHQMNLPIRLIDKTDTEIVNQTKTKTLL